MSPLATWMILFGRFLPKPAERPAQENIGGDSSKG